MTPGPRAILAACATALVGCSSEPQPRIEAIAPARAYTDRDMRLMLVGADFIPSFRLDPVSGERVAMMEGFSGRVGIDPTWEPLVDFGWIGPTQISVGLARDDAEDLPIGWCDVEITDPRGHQAVLQTSFYAMGPDPPPTLKFNSPTGGELYAPGSKIHASVTAADEPPGHMTSLAWTYTEPAVNGVQRQPVTGYCPCEPGSDHIDCAFDVTIGTNLEQGMTVTLNMVARDDAVRPNEISQDYPPILITARPTVASVTPPAGGVAGGTNVVIHGSGFVAGSRAYFGNDLLIPDGGIVVVGTGIITGYTPAHIAGSVSVIVQSRLGFAEWDHKFEYKLPPRIVSISPSFGVQGQDTHVQVNGTNFTAATIIYLGQTLASARPLARTSWKSDQEIDGVVPSASGQATVWAFDVNNGWTSLPDGFSWIVP